MVAFLAVAVGLVLAVAVGLVLAVAAPRPRHRRHNVAACRRIGAALGPIDLQIAAV